MFALVLQICMVICIPLCSVGARLGGFYLFVFSENNVVLPAICIYQLRCSEKLPGFIFPA